MTVIDRRAGRVLLLDRAGRVLLLHGGDPARPGMRWWFTPGGGLEPGETVAEAAVRELFEETGLRARPGDLDGPVWHEVAEFEYDGGHYRQDQDFFVLRVSEWQVDTAGMTADEQLTITEHRWWSAAEIESSTEQIFPDGLAGLLRATTVERGR
ncbi:8-oxo-dGTP pyrophosphatase MutT (NUDIX family) [Actinoplanes lutulentus]|uniref:ADP-ribose pyrophosphatase YjhB (NUDIX family) n=1 Tax=Actinoplanes lutulentus TaxID=1287878 RepID=A0A327Z705_9ACTN|nr:NUDIX domain-containing protein [Actinoplanes lutulentus]MBB2942218.1 8-oxo-dGTP pyrophosphatase MutT (NUDIX family) [Actinoplanes lutulentus]RAK32987.1 ADP-ribose pyrophosphatase YjhB (NUDIX family) [Actinoplanes lutulentus]